MSELFKPCICGAMCEHNLLMLRNHGRKLGRLGLEQNRRFGTEIRVTRLETRSKTRGKSPRVRAMLAHLPLVVNQKGLVVGSSMETACLRSTAVSTIAAMARRV